MIPYLTTQPIASSSPVAETAVVTESSKVVQKMPQIETVQQLVSEITGQKLHDVKRGVRDESKADEALCVHFAPGESP